MTEAQILDRMKSIEEKEAILDHNLEMPEANRAQSAGFVTNEEIERQLDALDDRWEELFDMLNPSHLS